MNKRGFTLVELLTVIAIITILSTVVIVSTSKARSEARDAKRKADLNSVSTSLEMYYAKQRKYPVLGAGWASISALNTYLTDFLSAIPNDPKNSEPFIYKYCVDNSTNPTKYILDVAIEDEKETSTVSFVDSVSTGMCPVTVSSYFTGTYTDSSDGKVHYRVSSK